MASVSRDTGVWIILTRETLRHFINAMAALGVKVMITEMDIDVLPSATDYRGADISVRAELRKELNPYVDGLPDEMQKKLADRYAELFSIFAQTCRQNRPRYLLGRLRQNMLAQQLACQGTHKLSSCCLTETISPSRPFLPLLKQPRAKSDFRHVRLQKP